MFTYDKPHLFKLIAIGLHINKKDIFMP